MRALIAVSLFVALILSIVACQGDAGPPGPQGPAGAAGPAGPPGSAGDIASLDKATSPRSSSSCKSCHAGLSVARKEDSERLDNLIHLIIENTRTRPSRSG